jgi:hypothetical protein
MPRPHIQQLTNELAALAKANWADRDILMGIAAELELRKRQRAKNLQKEIAERISQLKKETVAFEWPSTDVEEGNGSLDSGVFRHSSGLLRYMDYKVGVNGYVARDRREILERTYEETLPRVNSPSYMAEWGTPSSSQRLQKMADSIASFVRNAKRQSYNDMSMSVDEWESDLAYLKKRYYDGCYNFPWPRT